MNPNDDFMTTQQDLAIRARQKDLNLRIQKLLRENGASENEAESSSGMLSESWEIMARMTTYIENLAAIEALCDKIGGEAISFSPEMSAEITHLEANLEALKSSVASIGILSEKAASNRR